MQQEFEQPHPIDSNPQLPPEVPKSAAEEEQVQDVPPVTIANVVPILEDRVKQRKIDPAALFERVNLDGCVASDQFEVFNLANAYFALGRMHNDKQPRPVVALMIDSAFNIEHFWTLAAHQLGRQSLETEGAREFIRDFVDQKIGTEARARGSEAFHVAVMVRPDEIFNREPGAKEAFISSVHELAGILDVLNENYEITFSVYSELTEMVLPESLHDIIIPAR